MKTQGEDSHLQVSEKEHGRNQPCLTLDLRLLGSRTTKKKKKKNSAVQASQSVELCYGSPNTTRDGKFYCPSDDNMAPASVPHFYTHMYSLKKPLLSSSCFRISSLMIKIEKLKFL